VVWGEGRLVPGAEGGRELLRAVGREIGTQRLRGEVQPADEPEQAFGRSVGWGLGGGGEFGADEGLQGERGGGGGEKAVPDFLGRVRAGTALQVEGDRWVP
jgi:hypothetical protein